MTTQNDLAVVERQAMESPAQVSTVQSPQSDASILGVIERAAANPSVDVAKMERLYAMLKDDRAMVAEQQFNASMREAQSEMPVIVKDAKNPQTNSRYALLESVKRKAVPVITKHGFSQQFSQGDGAPEGKIRVLCNVSHVGGHSRLYHMDLSPDDVGAKGNASKTKIHGEGSTFSYGERYLTKLIFNITIVGEDDDGNQGNRPKQPGAGTMGGVDDRALKRKLADLLRADLNLPEGYAITDEHRARIIQHLADLDLVTPDETLADVVGKRLAEVVGKLEKHN